MYYIRYADVILLAAEASFMIHGSADATALNYLNMIRQRARMCGNGVNPVDLPTPVTKQYIMDERFREFGMEGERFFDLVRLHEAKNVLNNSKLEGTKETVNYTEPLNDFFPLPLTETVKNPNLKQYPGWD
jgi:hypothetical protein